MTHARALQIKSIARGPISYIRLYGTIDESFEPDALLEAGEGRDVILNLKAVTRISSFGVREWVQAMEALGKKANRMVFVECSPTVVSQLNMIANFAGGASVVSVQVPFYCDGCGWDTEQTVELSNAPPAGELPAIQCRRCDAAMEMDDEPESYFAFQQTVSQKRPDKDLLAFMRDFATAMDAPKTADPEAAANPTAPQSPSFDSPSPAPAAGKVAHTSRKTSAGFSSTQRAAIGALGLVVVVLGSLVAWKLTQPGISEDEMLALTGHVQAARFEEAEAMLERLEAKGVLKGGTLQRFHSDISESKKALVRRLSDEIVQLRSEKRFAKALEKADAAQKLGSLSSDAALAVAECLRHTQQRAAAAEAYDAFIEQHADHAKLPEAMLWAAEMHMQLKNIDKAKLLYQRIAEEARSPQHKKLAKRRLQALAK